MDFAYSRRLRELKERAAGLAESLRPGAEVRPRRSPVIAGSSWRPTSAHVTSSTLDVPGAVTDSAGAFA